MFDKEPIIISSVEDYVNVINQHNKTSNKLFYRGQKSYKKYLLLPSFLRENEGGSRIYNKEAEQTFLDKFRSRSLPYLNNVPTNNWEWLFLMQHYKTPTRLLDWSESPLVALFFAVEDADTFADDQAVVWILDPLKLNSMYKLVQPMDEVPNIVSDQLFVQGIETGYGVGNYTMEDKPYAIIGPNNNTRISAQKGVFTLFGHSGKPIESLDEANDILTKILIDTTKLQHIKDQLFILGITNMTVYPGLDSLSSDIVVEYQNSKKEVNLDEK